jgi:hypothetical protein
MRKNIVLATDNMADAEHELTEAPTTHASSSTMPPEELEDAHSVDPRLHKRTLLKLDFILLPFLALLFLFNALDKANVSTITQFTPSQAHANVQRLEMPNPHTSPPTSGSRRAP